MAHRSEVAFIRAELRTGLTMAHIALSTTRNDKRERTRTMARKAYDVVQRFAPSMQFGSETEYVRGRLRELKNCLLQLGEEV